MTEIWVKNMAPLFPVLKPPKRPMTAYMLWLGDNRKNIKKPGMRVTDVTKAAGVLWNNMKEEDKTIWQNKAAEAQEKYQKDMVEYNKFIANLECELVADMYPENQRSGGSKVSQILAKRSADVSTSGAKESAVPPEKIKSVAEHGASSSESEAKSKVESSDPESD